MIEDVMKALERIPAYKRALATADEVERLKERVAAIEARPAPAIGESCPRCREMKFALIETIPAKPPCGSGAIQVRFR
jgi:hypothetical protein